jgi:hypothetical protein
MSSSLRTFDVHEFLLKGGIGKTSSALEKEIAFTLKAIATLFTTFRKAPSS